MVLTSAAFYHRWVKSLGVCVLWKSLGVCVLWKSLGVYSLASLCYIYN